MPGNKNTSVNASHASLARETRLIFPDPIDLRNAHCFFHPNVAKHFWVCVCGGVFSPFPSKMVQHLPCLIDGYSWCAWTCLVGMRNPSQVTFHSILFGVAFAPCTFSYIVQQNKIPCNTNFVDVCIIIQPAQNWKIFLLTTHLLRCVKAIRGTFSFKPPFKPGLYSLCFFGFIVNVDDKSNVLLFCLKKQKEKKISHTYENVPL